MTTKSKLLTVVLSIHGSLALCLGLALLYLHATMTNLLFEVFAVVIAILLCAAAPTPAAITDWFAAFTAGMKKLHRVTFYLLAGVSFALAGIFIGTYPLMAMQWLVIFAVVHALVFGTSAFVYAFRANHHPQKRNAMYFFGPISILFSCAMDGLVRYLDESSVTAVLLRGREGALSCVGFSARRDNAGQALDDPRPCLSQKALCCNRHQALASQQSGSRRTETNAIGAGGKPS